MCNKALLLDSLGSGIAVPVDGVGSWLRIQTGPSSLEERVAQNPGKLHQSCWKVVQSRLWVDTYIAASDV